MTADLAELAERLRAGLERTRDRAPDRRPRSKARCRKLPYSDEAAADAALVARLDRTLTLGQHRPKTECRAYRCPECGAWHLTAMAAR